MSLQWKEVDPRLARLSEDHPELEDRDASVRKGLYAHVQNMYGFPRTDNRGRTASVSSFATDQSSSNATYRASNTSLSKEHKKRTKRNFRTFAKLLMRFLEKRDTQIFRAAQEVIRGCEERKLRGEVGYESVTENVQLHLRKVVGDTYWREARRLHEDSLLQRSQSDSSSGSSDNEYAILASFADSQSGHNHVRHHTPIHEQHSWELWNASPLTITSNWNTGREKEIRRERFYIILRVLMKYLETKDKAKYIRAKAVIDRCVAQCNAQEVGCTQLCETIKRSVKSVVGERDWRKAEAYLSKAIIQHNRERSQDDYLMFDQVDGEDYGSEQDLTPIPLSEDFSRRLYVDDSNPLSRPTDTSGEATTISSKRCIEDERLVSTSSHFQEETKAESEGVENTNLDYKRRRLDYIVEQDDEANEGVLVAGSHCDVTSVLSIIC